MKKKELKKRVQELEADILELVLNPGSFKSLQIKQLALFNYSIEKTIWWSSLTSTKDDIGMTGIIKTITNA